LGEKEREKMLILAMEGTSEVIAKDRWRKEQARKCIILFEVTKVG
jgi:hypothetical protein